MKAPLHEFYGLIPKQMQGFWLSGSLFIYMTLFRKKELQETISYRSFYADSI